MSLQLGKKKTNLMILAGLATLLLLYYGYKYYLAEPPISDMMILAASEVNKTCPAMVDPSTRLDSAVADVPDKIFWYDYTIVNLLKKDIDTAYARKKMEPGIINNVRTNPDLEIFRENKLTIAYHYEDKKGENIMTIFVTPDEYGAK